jgi:hypothetical protein
MILDLEKVDAGGGVGTILVGIGLLALLATLVSAVASPWNAGPEERREITAAAGRRTTGRSIVPGHWPFSDTEARRRRLSEGPADRPSAAGPRSRTRATMTGTLW